MNGAESRIYILPLGGCSGPGRCAGMEKGFGIGGGRGWEKMNMGNVVMT